MAAKKGVATTRCNVFFSFFFSGLGEALLLVFGYESWLFF